MQFNDFRAEFWLMIFGLFVVVLLSVVLPWLLLAAAALIWPGFWLAAHIIGGVLAMAIAAFWFVVFFGG